MTQIDHPTLPLVKAAFPSQELKATSFRGLTTLIVPSEAIHQIARFLRDDPECDFNFMSDVTAVDYLEYPAEMPGRFAVVYLLLSHSNNCRLALKTFLDPTLDTTGIEPDPGLEIESMTDLWPGAEWPEREVYDMYGIRFTNHPDLRRLLLWKDYPAHPLRKDYPLRGRGEREQHGVIGRDAS